MIRYTITKQELEQKISAVSSTWLRNARKKTAGFRRLRRYTGKTGTWGKIKSVYMAIQYNKCAYCEQKSEGGIIGAINHDIEHYRPKGTVKVWPDEKTKAELRLGYKFATGKQSRSGYYLLAYNILNYITACKGCNSMLKMNYFPISGSRRVTSSDDVDRLAEGPLLIYPLSDIDDDPERIIGFEGTVPVPIISTGYKKKRARVTIDFFRLLVGREDLATQRALVIKALYRAYQDRRISDLSKRRDAELTLRDARRDSSPHANCARCFLAVCESHPGMARDYYLAAVAYLESKNY